MYMVFCRKKDREKDRGKGGGGVEADPKVGEVVSENPPGLLPPDPCLWAHITHTRSHIDQLTSARSRVTELAR